MAACDKETGKVAKPVRRARRSATGQNPFHDMSGVCPESGAPIANTGAGRRPPCAPTPWRLAGADVDAGAERRFGVLGVARACAVVLL